MKYETATILIAFFGLSTAAPVPEAKNVFKLPTRMLRGREVPQEHSHNDFIATVRTSLAINNPAAIGDPIFGLLGSAAAAAGQGTISDVNCLQQATADQAFTNAKAAGDVLGMTAALVYRAIERNTGTVGLASVPCTSIKAVNPEIAALAQHQDPASTGAAATNKAITLELAKQIASIGGNSQTALQSGTFAPGDLSDTTGKGNTCDTADDTEGCIFSQNLLVEDATADEITAAVAGVAPAANASASAASVASVAPAASSAAVPAASSAASTSTPAAALDFGSCTDPSIAFGLGFDGRTEDSFEPSNLGDFNHGSALNIGVVASFICGQLSSSCDASAATNTACTAAESAAAAATGQAAADAFNSALGVSAASSTASAPAAASSSVAVAASPTVAAVAATAASATAASGNVQTFTGALGGAPPAVANVGGDRPFSVDGATFVNAAAAIQRSCSVQHNACATAANSGTLAGGEAQCETQETACNAAIAA